MASGKAGDKTESGTAAVVVGALESLGHSLSPADATALAAKLADKERGELENL